MPIIRKKLSSAGRDFRISPHFTLGEMACRDGSDVVLYSTALLAKLEELRAYVGGAVTITSGYRTAAYNRKIGGASLSQHVKGTAADIRVIKDGKALPAQVLCCLCQTLGFRGVAFISDTALHVDMRESGSYRGDERQGYGGNVGGDFYRYFGVSPASVAALKATPPKGEEKMNDTQFKALFEAYLAQRAKAPAGAWSEDARKRVEALGLFKGDGDGEMAYKSFCTREELAVIVARLYDLLTK